MAYDGSDNIYFVLEKDADGLNYLFVYNITDDTLTELSQFLKTKKDLIPSKVEKLLSEWRDAKKKLETMRSLLDDNNIENLISNAKNYKDYKLILNTVENLSQKDLQNISVKILRKSNDLITLFINNTDNGVMVMGILGKNASKKSDLHMGNIVKEIVSNFAGNGGGRYDYGQGLIKDKEIDLNTILEYIDKILKAWGKFSHTSINSIWDILFVMM